ncbi:unnamed protein product [Closterium sp. Yama58-4]|nr:unnamed protein product [Closterium sp. Yama58-4]
MCDWPDSGGDDQKRSFCGFSVFRHMPSAEESQKLLDDQGVGRSTDVEHASVSGGWSNQITGCDAPLSPPAAQRVAAQPRRRTQPQSPSLSPPSSPAAKTTPKSLHFQPLTLVYISDSALPSPHRPPVAPASARPPSCSAVAALSLAAVSVGPDSINTRASPCLLPSPTCGNSNAGSSSRVPDGPQATAPLSVAPLIVPNQLPQLLSAPLEPTPSAPPAFALPPSAPSPSAASPSAPSPSAPSPSAPSPSAPSPSAPSPSAPSPSAPSPSAPSPSAFPGDRQGIVSFVPNASAHGVAGGEGLRLSREDVRELNEKLMRMGVGGRHLDAIVDEFGWTLLHVAARGGDIHVVQALLGLGIPAGVRAGNLTTPMHQAAGRGHVACMELLLHHGADIRAETKGGWTPLHNAASNGKWCAVEWLGQQRIEPEEVETNPSPHLLPDHLLRRARHMLSQERSRRFMEEVIN